MSRRLHEFVKVLLSPIMLPIARGPLRGRRWIATSGSAFITGRYEPEKTAALASAVGPGDIVFDVGAHVGYFSVLMADRAGPRGHVYAFEPRPLNLRFLRRHIEVNRCTNVTVMDLAVGAGDGMARFDTRTGTGTGHLSPAGNLEVGMTSLDALVDAGRLPPPTFVKIDIEGGEVDALTGALRMLARHRPRLMLATHGDALDRACRGILEPLGYRFEDIGQLKGDVEYLVIP